MNITWYGTASVKLESGGNSIFFDPFVPLEGSTTIIPAHAYDEARDIFITHGHVDHIGSLNKMVRDDSCIYCTRTPLGTLTAKGIDRERLYLIRPGSRIKTGSFELDVFKAKHISFDRRLVLSTIMNPDVIKRFPQAMKLGSENLVCRENGETVAYLVRAEGKSIFILGSLALDENTEYPADMDLLVLPFQGNSDLLTPAKTIVKRLRPKAVFLDHFDNTFPPVSRNIDTVGIEAYLKVIGLRVIKPIAEMEYTV